jgi:hypothetical protein
MSAPPPSDLDFAALPSLELLGHVPWATAHPGDPVALRFAAAFFERYRHPVTRRIAVQFGFRVDPVTVHSAVHDAFLRFFRLDGAPARGIPFDVARARTNEECDAMVIAYLLRGAGWRTLDAQRLASARQESAVDPSVLDDRSASDEPTVESATALRLRSLVADWIATLSPRDEDVLRAYFLDDHAGQKGDRLPPAVVKALTAKYRIGAPALRQIKARLKRELHAYLTTHRHATPES